MSMHRVQRIALAAGGAALVACHGGRTAAPRPAAAVRSDTVVPGDPRVDARRLATGRRDFDWFSEGPAGRRTLGRWRDTLAVARSTEGDVLTRVLAVDLGRTTLIDSSWSDPRTLAPFRHRSAQPGRALEVRWRDTAITAWVAPANGPRQPRDTVLGRTTFDSSNWDLVIRALDLGPGVVRVFPVYDVDNRLGWYRASVVGDTVVNGARAWVVEAALGNTWAELTIDAATRTVVRQRMGNPKAPMLVVPVAAAPAP